METVTRYEVEREVRPGAWKSLGNLASLYFGDAPVLFATRAEAEKEIRLSRKAVAPQRLRIVAHVDIVAIQPLDLEEFALPLIVRYMRLRGVVNRLQRYEPILDTKRATVGPDWARLSPWEGQSILFAPEVPLGKLRKRFPFARPSTVESVIRLLTLHELAHVAMGHALPEALTSRRNVTKLEAEADYLTALWWQKGLTPETVTAAAAEAARATAKAA